MTNLSRFFILICIALPLVTAAEDVCVRRPDLCDEKPRARKAKVKFDEEIERDFEEMTMEEDAAPVARRRPRAYPNAVMDFDAYVQMNNSHAAIARGPAAFFKNQKAFAPAVVKSTIIGLPSEKEDPKVAPLGTTDPFATPTAPAPATSSPTPR